MKSIETRLLDALELFQYSYRFRNSLFVLVLESDTSLDDILTDLKLLQSSHISVMIALEDSERLAVRLQKLTERGLRFWHVPCPDSSCLSESDRARIRTAFGNDIMPVIALQPRLAPSASTLCREALQLADYYDADKLFYLSDERALYVDEVLQSHLAPEELEEAISSTSELNIDREILEFFRQASMEHGLEIVILEGVPGSLFQEIFTHQGRGTLLTDAYPNVIRRGRLSDVLEISRLLRPYIEDGTILPTNEDEIADQIESYFVYTVNEAIVAASQLDDYGDAAALSKFCTLPRYQGKGRARQLAKRMIETAVELKKDYVFALSISPRMWSFFEQLGFHEVPRESLPQRWQQGYDFSRPSRALRLDLKGVKRKRKRRTGDETT